MTVLDARSVRLRMWWTTLLVLIALGGAGLAVASDRPQNPVQRPEVTWRADQEALPWIEALAGQLELIDRDVVDLSDDGRHVLRNLQSLQLDAMNTEIAAGDELATTLESKLATLSASRDEALEHIEEWRLGPQTLALLGQVTDAVDSAEDLPGIWRGLAADAQEVADLVDSLLRHDGLVFRATTAGRQGEWDSALNFLSDAAGPLASARQIRDALAAESLDVTTLDDLMGRLAAYDEALVALYTYVRDTGERSGPQFEALQQEVDRTQAALPSNTSALSVIVGDGAGPTLTAALVDIEQAHGAILDALLAVNPPVLDE